MLIKAHLITLIKVIASSASPGQQSTPKTRAVRMITVELNLMLTNVNPEIQVQKKMMKYPLKHIVTTPPTVHEEHCQKTSIVIFIIIITLLLFQKR